VFAEPVMSALFLIHNPVIQNFVKPGLRAEKPVGKKNRVQRDFLLAKGD